MWTTSPNEEVLTTSSLGVWLMAGNTLVEVEAGLPQDQFQCALLAGKKGLRLLPCLLTGGNIL
jgi:hypothetical protein